MDQPFQYSHYVSGKQFVGRKRELSILGNLLSQGEHVVMYEPPKFGISSIIQQALFNIRINGVKFNAGWFSAMGTRTVADFAINYARTAVKTVASTPEEFKAIVAEFLQDTHIVFDLQAYSQRGEVLSYSWEADRKDLAALFALPFSLRRQDDSRLILIIEDFNCVNSFDNPDQAQVLLAAAMKAAAENQDRKVSLVMCGNAVNAMDSIFGKSYLFRRLVERVKLSPIDTKEMAEFASRGFLSSGKVINQDLLLGAFELFKGHPWYMNHFACICDSLTKGFIMEPVLKEALETVIAVHEPRFKDIINSLTTFQLNFLKACLNGVTRFSSSEVISRYGFNSAANVKRIKDALMKKEVIAFDSEDIPHILDPLFEYWCKNIFC